MKTDIKMHCELSVYRGSGGGEESRTLDFPNAIQMICRPDYADMLKRHFRFVSLWTAYFYLSVIHT